VKLKNQKAIAVDVLFKACPMVPLSCRSNLAGQYTFKGGKNMKCNFVKLIRRLIYKYIKFPKKCKLAKQSQRLMSASSLILEYNMS